MKNLKDRIDSRDVNPKPNLQTPIILSCTGALAFQAYMKYESTRLGDNSETLLLSQSAFFSHEIIPMNIGIIFIFVFIIISLLLYPILSYFCYKIIENNIFKKDPTERIIYTYRPLIFVANIPYAVSGYFLGCYILPLLFFPNITHIDMVSHENLPLYILLFLAFLLFAFTYQYNSIILTNKRVINSFLFFPCWTKSMFLNDIKHIQEIGNTFALTSKAGGVIGILRWRKNKVNIFKQKLEEEIRKTRRVINEYND